MKAWLARLSFSFFIIAAVLAWEAYKLGASSGRATLYYVVAAMAMSLGFAGVRERHRKD